MAAIQKPITSVLGANTVGGAATYATGSKWWLIATTVATLIAGFIAIALSLVARHYRHRRR